MTAQAMAHPQFFYADSRHYAHHHHNHHAAMQHMAMYQAVPTLPSTPVYTRPSSACSQPMVPTLYSNAPSALTPMGSPAPQMAQHSNNKPSMLDTQVCPSTPPLSTSGSVISSPGSCDLLQTPMNPMFSGFDGVDTLKQDFEPETLVQEWAQGCSSPPMTPGKFACARLLYISCFSLCSPMTTECGTGGGLEREGKEGACLPRLCTVGG